MIKKILNNSAFSGTIILTIGSFVASGFAYVLQLFLGRHLTIEDFGTFNTLLSFSTILGVFSGSLSAAVVKKVSALCAEGRFKVLTKLFWGLNFVALGLGILLFLPLYFLRGFITDFLNISDSVAFISFAAFMGSTFLSALPRAYLQGLLRFKSLAFWNSLASFLRTLFPVVLVFLGYSLAAVFLGMFGAALVSVFLALFLLEEDFDNSGEISLTSHYRSILLFLGPVIFMQVGLTLLNNADIILVKHFFESYEAGVYSALVVIGKVLLFGAGAASVIMFPQISAAVASGENPKEKLKPFLLIQLFLVVCGTLVFALLPKLITLIMFGERYLPAVQYLPRFSLFMGFYIMINFFILFFIAMEKYFATVFLGLGVFLQVVLIWFFHDSLSTVVNINMGISGIIMALLILYYLFFDKVTSRDVSR